MEYLDLYTRDLEPTGVTIRRGDPQPEGMYHLIAAVWICSSRREILVTRRAMAKEVYPDTLENPGGAVRSGETMAGGAIRELREEIGLAAEEKELILLDNVQGSTAIYGLYFMKRDVPLGALVLQKEEVSEAMWLPLERFLALMDEDGPFAPPVKKRFSAVRESFMQLVGNV